MLKQFSFLILSISLLLVWLNPSARAMLSSVPDFIQVFPTELEKQSFAVFDWTEAQFKNSNFVFAKDIVSADREAGQSGVIL